MNELGKKLKAKRELLKLTYQDVAKRTKLSQEYIEAIESGNVDFFKDDITYLRFYVRAYCKAIDLPFEEIKGDYEYMVDEFTQSVSLAEIEKAAKLEEAIANRANIEHEKLEAAKRDHKSIIQNASQNQRFRKVRKVDMSLVSIVVVVLLIVAIFVYVLFTQILPGNQNAAPETPETTQETPTPEPEPTKEETPVVVDTSTYKVETESADGQSSTYRITGLKKDSDLSIVYKFKLISWFSATLNGQDIANVSTMPSQTTIEAGDSATYEGKLGGLDTFIFQFGNFQEIELSINGKVVPWDAATKASSGIYALTLIIEGE